MGKSSFQTAESGWRLNLLPFQNAAKPMEPDVSVNNCMTLGSDQEEPRKSDLPFQVGTKSSHQWRSAFALWLM